MNDDPTGGNGCSHRPPGVGMLMRWLCMGCNQRRPVEGARGRGIHRRCAACVATHRTKDTNEPGSDH